MSELENRKKLLIAEAEVYRETLKFELKNVELCCLRAKRKLTSLKPGNPLLAFGIPLLASLVGRKNRPRRWGALAFIGWQLYNRFGGMLGRRIFRPRRAEIAAEEHLERRM